MFRGPGGEGGGRPPRNDPPPRNEPPRNDPPRGKQPTGTNAAAKTGFVVSSPAIGADGMLPVEFTCDGQSASPPIQWKEAPAGTKSFALSLWHTAPDQEKSYWPVYNIPANVDQFFYLQFSFVTKPVRPRFSDRCGKFTLLNPIRRAAE